MKTLIKGSRIELIPEEEIDRDRLAQIPEGSNEVFVYTTLDGGDEGNQEAVVIHIGPVPTEEEVLEAIKDPTKPDEGAHRIILEKRGGRFPWQQDLARKEAS